MEGMCRLHVVSAVSVPALTTHTSLLATAGQPRTGNGLTRLLTAIVEIEPFHDDILTGNADCVVCGLWNRSGGVCRPSSSFHTLKWVATSFATVDNATVDSTVDEPLRVYRYSSPPTAPFFSCAEPATHGLIQPNQTGPLFDPLRKVVGHAVPRSSGYGPHLKIPCPVSCIEPATVHERVPVPVRCPLACPLRPHMPYRPACSPGRRLR